MVLASGILRSQTSRVGHPCLETPVIRIASLFAIALLATPSLAESQDKKRECSVDSATVTRFTGMAVFRDCDVDKPAKLRTPPRPQFDFGRSTSEQCAAATFEMLIDSTGVVDTTSVLVSDANNPAFVAAVLKTLPRWRYTPAELGGRKVSQVVSERRTFANEVRRQSMIVTRTQDGREVSRSQPRDISPPKPVCR